MKKITFLMLHLNYGGLEKQTVSLINSLANKGYNIEIISVYDILGKSFYNTNPSVKIKYLTKGFPNKIKIKEALKSFNVFKLFKELCITLKCLYNKYIILKKVIQKLDTDIIVSTREEFSKLIKRKDTLNISCEHSFFSCDKYYKKVKRSFINIDKIVVMTDKAKSYYNKFLNNEVVVIENMIEPNITNNISNLQNKQIVSIGRLENIKNIETLINIFSNISKKHPEYILKIIGEGSLKQNLVKQVEKLNLKNKVIFTGKLDSNQVKKELINSQIFCLTSKSESFSLVICEAMNYGLPVVSFDIDVGPKEIIDNNINGFLVKYNDINEYVNKLNMLITDKDLRNRISIQASKTAIKYYPDNIIHKWIDIFEDNNE